MAATIIINEWNGAAPGTVTQKDSGTVRFKNADNATVDTNDPLIVPASGQEYSVEKFLGFQMTVGPTDNISNLEFYMDGANGFGTGVKLWGTVRADYKAPAVPSEANAIPQHGTLSTTMSDAFGWTSGAPKTLAAGPFSATGTLIGSYVVLVMEAESTATAGATAGETATFEWDEI